jgi:hypothetical protein
LDKPRDEFFNRSRPEDRAAYPLRSPLEPESIAGMKLALKMVASFLLSALLFVIGEFVRHPRECDDCFAPHGFPFTYRHEGGFSGGGDFYQGWLNADIASYVILSIAIASIWLVRTQENR